MVSTMISAALTLSCLSPIVEYMRLLIAPIGIRIFGYIPAADLM